MNNRYLETEEQFLRLLNDARPVEERLVLTNALVTYLLHLLREEEVLLNLVAAKGAKLDLWSGGHLSDCSLESTNHCDCGYKKILDDWNVAYKQFLHHRYE